jgi:hypothetical protein
VLRLAASSPWPILIFWGLFVLLARVAKKKAQPPRKPLARFEAPDSSRVELGDALQRAMEKLKQAEREAQARRTGGQAVRRTVSAMVPSARPLVRPSARLVLEDHSAQSQESEPEVVDYDDDAAQLEEKRVREASEAFERSPEDEPAGPFTRIAPSLRAAPPSAAAAFALPSARPPVRRNALARFADGSLKGAVILSEILGRPISDR